jgi:hypothetical protein
VQVRCPPITPRQPGWLGPVNGRPLGHRIRVPKTAELVAADLRRKIVRGELADAAQHADRVRHAALDVGRPGHVRDDGQRRAAGFGDLRRDREQLGLGAADQRDGGALGGQGKRDAAAAEGAAGDNGPLAVQCPCHAAGSLRCLLTRSIMILNSLIN